jgi:hypothetical protein
LVAAGLAIICLHLPDARAVVDGRPDANGHPNVGMILGSDSEGPILSCTGTLIAPAVVLTNAHCVQDLPDLPITKYEVSFESEAFFDYPPSGLVNSISGSPEPHPNWTWEEAEQQKATQDFLRYQGFDIGLLHLAEPAANTYPGIAPAPIIGANALDALVKPNKTMATQVGYGIQRSGPFGQEDSFFIDGTRNQSTFPLSKILDTVVLNHQNPNDSRGYGAPCSGDSGSPWFFGDGTIGVLFSFHRGSCGSQGGGARLDTGPARAFLRSRGLVP